MVKVNDVHAKHRAATALVCAVRETSTDYLEIEGECLW
jgi:hypothetical protein